MISHQRCFKAVVQDWFPRGGISLWGRGLLVVFLSFFVVACAAPRVASPKRQVFKNYSLTTDLQRGVSSMADVRRVLGEPNGSGGYLFPIGTGEGPIWFYESVKIDTSSRKIDLQQDILLVFFKGDRFEGFLWFSDASKEMMKR